MKVERGWATDDVGSVITRVWTCALPLFAAAVATCPATAGQWDVVPMPEAAIVLDADIEGSVLWLSTRNVGLIGYDGLSWVLHRAADCDSCIRTDSYNYTVLADDAGHKWLGRDDSRTVDRLDDGGTFSDKSDDVWYHYSYQVELENRRVFSMAEDLSGNKWFGMRDEMHSYPGTVELFVENNVGTPDDDQWFHYDNAWTPDSTRFADDDVRAVAVDTAGRLWIGYFTNGVDVWDYGNPATFADDVWDRFTSFEGLASDLVRELHVSDDGRVWVGTLAGLSVYDPSTGSMESIGELGDEEIGAIDSDAQGHIWVGTESGVTMLYRDGSLAFRYDTEDGIRDAAVVELAVDRTRGIVWAISADDETARTTLNRFETPYGSSKDGFFVYPNPLKGGGASVSVMIVGVPDGSTLEIFDLNGQKVRELGPRSEPYVWDTLNSSSFEVPSGVYVIRMETPEGRVAFTKSAIIR